MAAAVQQLIGQVQALSPADRDELRGWINAAADAGIHDPFARKLVESGIGRPRPAGPRHPNAAPVPAEGQPISEQLIEERR